MPLVPAIVLGEGYAGATMMGVVRSLGRANIPVSVFSSHPHSPARFSRYCDYHQVPDAVRQPAALEGFLLEYAAKLSRKPILFLIGDAEVSFLAERAERFRRYYQFNLAAPRLVRDLANKRSQYEIAVRSGMPIPRTYFGLNSTNVSSHDVEFPVVIKPVYAHLWPWRGVTKAVSAKHPGQLEEHLRELENRNIEVVVQSIIPGPPSELYTVVAYISNSESTALAASLRKIRQFPLDFGFGSLNEAVIVEELEAQVIHFLRGLGFTGVCGIEFKYDSRDCRFKFIELNPRFELAHCLIATAGADVARAMYADLSGHQIAARSHYQFGLRWISLSLDLKATRVLFARGELSFANWIDSIRNVRTEALLTWDDPLPGLWSYGRTAGCAFLPGLFNSPRVVPMRDDGEAL